MPRIRGMHAKDLDADLGFTIGSDPEFFVRSIGSDELIKSYDVLDGNKKEPIQMDCGSMYQCDNVLAELNVLPASTHNSFIDNTYKALNELNAILKKQGAFLDTKTVDTAIPAGWLADEQAVTFGCDPDFDCWFHDNIRPIVPEEVGDYRTAGGHIHVGVEEVDKAQLARNMDILIGVTSMRNSNKNKRRTLYGQAGRFRSKSYGIEYRVPDNSWVTSPFITSIPRLIEQAIQDTELADKWAERGDDAIVLLKNTINSCDKDNGKYILDWMGVM